MFNSARLQLTAWYLLIIMGISILFSGIIYKLLMHEFDRFEKAQRFRIQRGMAESEMITPEGVRIKLIIPPHMAINSELIDETSKRIIVMLVFMNGGILIISGLLSYFLAGRTLQPIKDMMDEQNRFIGDASHEIRTPLTSLKSAFEVFLRDKKATVQEAKEIVTESIDEVNKLQSLSDALLQLAQYEKPNGHTKFKKLKLNEVIEEAIQKVKPIAQEKHVTIFYEKLAVTLEGNIYGLTDLFVILFDNAIKYSAINSTVTVTTRKVDGTVKVVVQDEGIGIDEEDIPHIFDRFYRADKARTKKLGNGYGLGLAIAKKIIQRHKGSITVKNNQKKGVSFVITLPIRQSSRINKTFSFS